MWKPYHYITTFTELQTSALKSTMIFADKKYTHPIKNKQEVKCYLPWNSYSVRNFLHLVHDYFSIFLQKIFDFKTMCRGGGGGVGSVLNYIILN